MADVTPMAPEARQRVSPSPPTKEPPRFMSQAELEAYTHLVDLVSGNGPFELSWSDEYVDGAIAGLAPAIVHKLRNGEFSYQAHEDLHGLTRAEAREVVIRFVRRSYAAGLRCVLVIPGRGLNSNERRPVLKEHLVKWLSHAPLKRLVLAFASARSHDGGWGAFYVLLRRNERKAPLMIPAI